MPNATVDRVEYLNTLPPVQDMKKLQGIICSDAEYHHNAKPDLEKCSPWLTLKTHHIGMEAKLLPSRFLAGFGHLGKGIAWPSFGLQDAPAIRENAGRLVSNLTGNDCDTLPGSSRGSWIDVDSAHHLTAISNSAVPST